MAWQEDNDKKHNYPPFLVVVFHILQIAFGIFLLGKNRLLKCNGLIKGLFKQILLKEEVKGHNAQYYLLEMITSTMIHYETTPLPTNIILDKSSTFYTVFTLLNFNLFFSLLTVSFFRNCIDFHILMMINEFNTTIVK